MIIKILYYIAKYIFGKRLVISNGTTNRDIITGRYLKKPKKVFYYTDFHSEESWGKPEL
jgi:hypothetical protein